MISTIIRPATAGDGSVLQEIERLAGERFREVGLGYVADHDPMPLDDMSRHAADGQSWVATADGEPVGYIVVDVVDGDAHIAQVSVRPDHQGRGLARALIDRVEQWAVANDMPALSLTTFADVPWNRPLYEHLGFRVLDEHEIGPELQAVCAHEAKLGLDPSTRVCMLRPVQGSSELEPVERAAVAPRRAR